MNIMETRLHTYTRPAIGFALTAAALLLFGAGSALAAHQADNGEFVYGADLTGGAEVPAIMTDTTGSFSTLVSEDQTEMTFELEIEDGEAIVAAHLHCGVAGENGPVVGFLSGMIPGGFDVDGTLAAFTFTDANIIDADCPTAITDVESLATAMGAGEVYVNVHNIAHPSGVVRGQVMPIPQTEEEPMTPAVPTSPDADNDGFISVLEGVPFYGGIVSSLTTEGDTSADSALALDRFPVANADGMFSYERTFMLSDDVTDLEDLHIVIHGADLNTNGEYDGEKESSIAPGVPFEATVPVACGEVELTQNGQSYTADIRELNSTGAYGAATLTLDENQVYVTYTMQNVSPNIAHAQHFHMGGTNVCPPNTAGAGDMDGEMEMEEDMTEDEDQTAAMNLVSNGDFEINNGVHPTHWLKGGFGNNNAWFEYLPEHDSGSAVAKVSISDYQNGDAKWYHAPIAVEGGKTYTYSTDYAATAANELGIFFMTPDNQWYTYVGKIPTTDGAWDTASADFTVPHSATKVIVLHTLTGNGYLKYDNVSLVEKK